MRDARRNRNNNKGTDLKKAMYISGSILAVAIIAFVITFFVYGNKMEGEAKIGKLNTSIVDNYTENSIIEETSTQFGKTVNELSNETVEESSANEQVENQEKYAINTSKSENKVNTNSVVTKKNTAKTETKTNKVEQKQEEKKETPNFTRPVEGQVNKEFAKDKLVYSDTLGEWVTHNGVDIKAEKTSIVKAAAEGTVKSIKNDPRYGLTVVIEHTNGFTTVYSNLLTAEFVVVGEKVKQGQTIGTVGNTATFEISDEAHLHFEILKDSDYLNPELYLKD